MRLRTVEQLLFWEGPGENWPLWCLHLSQSHVDVCAIDTPATGIIHHVIVFSIKCDAQCAAEGTYKPV